MLYLGDFAQDKTVRLIFYTKVGGVPTAPNSALENTDIRIYKNGSNAQKTTTNGITMTSPFDSLTGCHLVEIDTSNDTGDGGFWVGASDYHIVLEPDETLGGVAFGSMIGLFSIENRSAVRPTVADRTLDVTATGAAGIDWANVENPTTAQNLSATNIDVDQVVASVSGAVGSVTGAVGSVTGNVGGNVVGSVASVTGNVGGNVVGSVASVTGNVGGNVTGSIGSVAAGGITAASLAADALTAAKVAADVGTEIATAVWAFGTRTLTSLGASLVQEIWDRATSALTTVGSIGKLLVDNINATISSRATQTSVDDLPTNAELAAALAAADDAVLTAIAALNNLSAAQVNAELLDVLATDTFAEPSGVPAATASLEDKIGWLYALARNKVTQTSTTQTLRNDADNGNIATAAVSDDGSTFTRAEWQ